MGLRIIWIQLDRAFEFALGAGPVTIVIVFNVSQRHMRFGESSIDLYGFQRRGLRLWQRLVWRCHSAGIWRAQQIISICQSTVSQRERGVLFYRPLKIFERLLQPFFGSFVVVKSSFHVKLISLDRKSTRLNSSHPSISYAVFCLKKKKKKYTTI